VNKPREFIDFWIENSVHAGERYLNIGASQDVAELARRLVESAQGQGISKSDLETEIGDISDYIRGKLRAANKAEGGRHRP
jgi:hypothetical protein